MPTIQNLHKALEKRSNNGGEGGLSYEAITAITICVAGFVMLMVLACAINMRRKHGEGRVDASDLDPEQQQYMRETRNRNRDTLTGTKRFTQAASFNPPQQNSYIANSGMSNYGYDDVYTPGWDSRGVSQRNSGVYADYSPEADHMRSLDPAGAEYFNHQAPPAAQPLMAAQPMAEPSEKPGTHAAVYEAEPTPYAEDQHHPSTKP